MIYENINQIFDGATRLVDDFTDADLSKLDLSHIKPEAWVGANFKNTNFRGTNIKFYPDDLKTFYVYDFEKDIPKYQYRDITGCNFEGCDLSYLEDSDFFRLMIQECNFKNTGLNIDFTNPKFCDYIYYNYGKNKLFGVTLPTSYSKKEREYWDYIDIDIEFLRKNPDFKVSSGKIMELIKEYLSVTRDQFYTAKDYDDRVEYAKKIIEYDKQGYLKRFYNMMKPYLKNIIEEEQFFLGEITDKSFDKLDLSYLPPKLLLQFYFEECNFKRLQLPFDINIIEELGDKDRKISGLFSRECNIDEVQIPITIHNWDNHSRSRMSNSEITFQTNLYVELKRICNMKCKFCRNLGLEKQKYNYDNIIKNLKVVYDNINNIVIGGGEPTLLLDDLKRLKQKVMKGYSSNKFSVITNGSLSVSDYKSLITEYKLYMSRHAIDDDENRAIFGDEKHTILTADELADINEFRYKKSILCCTCFKGGIDTKDKMIDYIKFAQELGYHDVLFQTLHQEENFENTIGQVETIDEEEITSMLAYLDMVGFTISKPIYSTSGYELHLAHSLDKNINISMKEYKDPKEILKKWHVSPKRCFDLSMAPNGDIYESWDQQQQPIKIKNR